MNRKIFSFVICISLLVVISCGGNDGPGTAETDNTTPAENSTPIEETDTYGVEGYVQKGPFISGSSVKIQELDDDLNPAGVTYDVIIKDDFGSFSLGSQIESRYVELFATGYYFNEVTGELSASTITLRAITDLSSGEKININILTTLEQERIRHLVSDKGFSFPNAVKQAEAEVLKIFNISEQNAASFTQMDISQEGDSNAILLAVSSILQNNNSVAELSELISKISIDISTDGSLDNAAYLEEIKNNSIGLNVDLVIANLESRYETLGLSLTPPEYAGYVDRDGDGLIGKDDDVDELNMSAITGISYPINGEYGQNLLIEDSISIEKIFNYSLRVEFQKKDSQVKVVFPIPETDGSNMWCWVVMPAPHGWHEGSGSSGDSGKQRIFITDSGTEYADMELLFTGHGSVIIEIYENGDETPTRTKEITW